MRYEVHYLYAIILTGTNEKGLPRYPFDRRDCTIVSPTKDMQESTAVVEIP